MTSVLAGLGSARLFTELNTALPHALDAHHRGYSVIPLRGGKNLTTGKRPQVDWRTYQKSHASSQQIHDWFDMGTSAYGIVCGQVSQLIVIDFDEPEAQAEFIKKFPHLMNTFSVKSGGRGTLHLYYEIDFSVKTSKIRGGDLKAEGSYVVGAGSQIAGRTWEVSNDTRLKRITQKELDDVLSVFGIASLSQQRSVIPTTKQSVSPHFFTSIYHSFVRQFKSRNEALFLVGCMMRDEGFDIETVTATLSQAHIQHPPVNRHSAETELQRHNETLLTLRSVFKQPARPKSTSIAKSGQASYVPNQLRQAILKHKHGTAFLRVYEGLKLVGKSAGTPMTEKDILTSLAPHSIGRRSIRNALHFTSDICHSKLSKTQTNTCVFVPTTKRDKSPSHRPSKRYIIPTIGRLLELFNIKKKGSDPITLEDIQSVQTYRSALNRELIRRRAGKYSQSWLAKRLSICVRTLQRYTKLANIQCEQILYATPITVDNIHQIPTRSHARRANIMIQHCFIQSAEGKRYPPIPALASKLLRQRIPIYWMRRGWNIYWVGSEGSYSNLILTESIEHVYK